MIRQTVKEVTMRQFMRGAKQGAFRPVALVIGLVAFIVLIIIVIAAGF